MNEKFTFWQVTVNEVEQIIKELPKNKEASGDIPRKVLKQSKFSFKGLRNWINWFPKDCKRYTYRQKRWSNCQNKLWTSKLPLLSKVFEGVIYDQLSGYINRYLNKLLYGFRRAHSTQHALFKLLLRWQN